MAKLQLLSENDFDENKKFILLMVLVMFDPGGILWTHKLILAQCVLSVVCVHYFANGNGTN